VQRGPILIGAETPNDKSQITKPKSQTNLNFQKGKNSNPGNQAPYTCSACDKEVSMSLRLEVEILAALGFVWDL
jgi:hypothetical protein